MNDYALTLSEAELARYQMMAEHAHQAEAAQWATIGIGPGASVADVGCGPGAVSTLMAGLVGDGGKVRAVDQDPEAVAAAEQLAARMGLTNVGFQVGQATDTGLEPASFDVAMTRHVLAHNGGREQAIVDHLASLVRPGGHVYLVDVDGTAMRSRPPEPDIDDLSRRYWSFQAARGNDVAVGLRLGELVAGAGLELVEHAGRYDIVTIGPGFRPPSWAARDVMVEAGFATADDVDRWGSAFERLDAAGGGLTVYVPLFTAIGRRPAAA